MAVERVKVLGIGNTLVKDEGVGVRVVEALMAGYEFPGNVEIVDAGTMGMSILNLFRDCDYMLVVDAIEGTGEAPGTVLRLSPEDLAPSQVMHSLHDVRLTDVLDAASLMGCRPCAECLGIQVEDMGGIEIGLSTAVESAVPAAVEAVLEILAERGIAANRCESESDDARVLEAIRTRDEIPRGI